MIMMIITIHKNDYCLENDKQLVRFWSAFENVTEAHFISIFCYFLSFMIICEDRFLFLYRNLNFFRIMKELRSTFVPHRVL